MCVYLLAFKDALLLSCSKFRLCRCLLNLLCFHGQKEKQIVFDVVNRGRVCVCVVCAHARVCSVRMRICSVCVRVCVRAPAKKEKDRLSRLLIYLSAAHSVLC